MLQKWIKDKEQGNIKIKGNWLKIKIRRWQEKSKKQCEIWNMNYTNSVGNGQNRENS